MYAVMKPSVQLKRLPITCPPNPPHPPPPTPHPPPPNPPSQHTKNYGTPTHEHLSMGLFAITFDASSALHPLHMKFVLQCQAKVIAGTLSGR